MANKYLNPDWKAINKAIAENKDTRAELKQELRDLTKKIDEKLQEQYHALKLKEAADKVEALKKLPVGSPVWYIGRTESLLGKQGTKKKDAIKRMTVDFEGGLSYLCYYTNLSPTPPTEREISDIQSNISIGKLLNH